MTLRAATLNPYRWYTRRWIALILAVLACIMLTNFVVDPYNVFHTPFLPIDMEGNQRFAKLEYLSRRPGAFNAFILGSSRASGLDPTTVDRLVPSARTYNLSIPAGTPNEHLAHLQYLVNHGFDVRRLLIQVDLDYLSDKREGIDYGLAPHPYVTDRSLLGAYWTYLTIFPTKVLKEKLAHNLRRTPHPVTLLVDTGVMAFGAAEEAIAHPGSAFFSAGQFTPRSADRDPFLDQTPQLDALRSMKHLCDTRAIECDFFTTPHHQLIMDTINAKGYLTAREALGSITPFVDFSGYNSVTTENRNYYEPSHYRPFIGEGMLERLYSPGAEQRDELFGISVTPATLALHLERAQRQLDARDRRPLHRDVAR